MLQLLVIMCPQFEAHAYTVINSHNMGTNQVWLDMYDLSGALAKSTDSVESFSPFTGDVSTAPFIPFNPSISYEIDPATGFVNYPDFPEIASLLQSSYN